MSDITPIIENIKNGRYKNPVAFSKANRSAYRKAEHGTVMLFKSDLERHFGLSNHPKRDKLWCLAWENGHSSGLSEVLYEYADMAELLVKP